MNNIITDNIEFVILITSCQKYIDKYSEKRKQYIEECKKYPIACYYFIGNPNLTKEYEIDEENKIITVNTPDDYLNLPNKVYNIIKVINSLFPNIYGLFKTDDNVELNIDNLYNKMKELYTNNYWGVETNTTELLFSVSYHLILHHQNNIPNELSLLKKYPISVNYNIRYCGGKGYYLNNNSINIVINNPQYFSKMYKNN